MIWFRFSERKWVSGRVEGESFDLYLFLVVLVYLFLRYVGDMKGLLLVLLGVIWNSSYVLKSFYLLEIYMEVFIDEMIWCLWFVLKIF